MQSNGPQAKYGLWIEVGKHGRMMNGISPSPFAIDFAAPLTWEDIEKYGGGADISTAQKSAKIISEGGIGEGVIIFNNRQPCRWRMERNRKGHCKRQYTGCCTFTYDRVAYRSSRSSPVLPTYKTFAELDTSGFHSAFYVKEELKGD
ncbi:hypothetical protein C8J57DRAFT_1230654 [Mycena rebaudengoi]|nr:hypothetical protein C8J57DRAFT_1230654 [Mycena rebaudengoi]